jgi:L-threonine synthase (EC 4.2.3.1)
MPQSYFSHLVCAECGKKHDGNIAQNVCTDPNCQGTLLAQYEFNKSNLTKEDLKNRPFDMWRYREFLPVLRSENIVTLGEGGTALLKADRLGKAFGLSNLYIKDEGENPTGSFKARGMSAALSKAKELGIQKIAIPTAGNAGVALAAYGAKAGFEVIVYMPIETPEQHKQECRYYGSKVIEVDGNIGDCGKLVAKLTQEEGYFNISTLKEPYRLEGKKPWVMNWPNSSTGNCPMSSFILQAGVQASLDSGKLSRNWRNSDGSGKKGLVSLPYSQIIAMV